MKKILSLIIALLIFQYIYAQDSIQQVYFTDSLSKIKASEGLLVDSVPEGKWVFYYADGSTIKESGEYTHGKKTGLWLEFYRTGDTLAKKPIEEGLYQSFYLLQQPLFEGNITKGERNGLWKEYYENGALKQTYNYINGVLDGDWVAF